jgi:branched-chain amino acid transport system ATP-binding protein
MELPRVRPHCGDRGLQTIWRWSKINDQFWSLRRAMERMGGMFALEDRPVLSANSLVKRFGGVAAVDGVTIGVGQGEIVGLIGPNGAGKTTLFDLIAGEQKPTSGRVWLNGAAIEALPPHSRLAHGLGRTFQIPRPFPGMTLIENVMLGAQGQSGERIWPNWFAPRLIAREERACRDKAMDLLAFVRLERLAREPARVLSGGERKLLELARALMAEPKLLLLDEPAAGVNPGLLEVIVKRIVEINRGGVAVLVIEHNMDVIVRLCARVYVMAAGKLLCEGRPEDVTRDPRVVEAYLGGAAA